MIEQMRIGIGIGSTRPAAALLALGATICLAGGCGGDDGSGDSTTTTTGSGDAKQQYIAAADAVCAKYNDELNGKVADEFGGQSATGAELSRFTEAVTIPLLTRQYKDFAAVPVPPAEQDQVDAINAAVDKALAESRRDPSAFFGGSGQGPSAFDAANQLEADFGFTQCGGGASP